MSSVCGSTGFMMFDCFMKSAILIFLYMGIIASAIIMIRRIMSAHVISHVREF